MLKIVIVEKETFTLLGINNAISHSPDLVWTNLSLKQYLRQKNIHPFRQVAIILVS